jgi:hypothetical protein
MAVEMHGVRIDRMEPVMRRPRVSPRVRNKNFDLGSELTRRCIEDPSLLDKIAGKHVIHYLEGDAELCAVNESIAARLREAGEEVLRVYWKLEK